MEECDKVDPGLSRVGDSQRMMERMENREYIQAREGLIPGAVATANAAVIEYRKANPTVSWDSIWTKEFCKAMDRAAYACGLLSWDPDSVVFGVRRRVKPQGT